MPPLALVLAATAILGAGQGPGAPSDRLTADVLKGIELRSIGPTLATGRVVDVQIDPKNPNVWYVVSAFSGLWKTVNRGVTFTPIFDDGGSFTLCCIAIDPKDSNVLYLGTGESNSQRSAHFGDGVYKSTDAGATWKRVGLATSEHIGDGDKQVLLVDRFKNLAAALSGVYDSQITGGKRYEVAGAGRRTAHASFFESHAADKADALSFAMDLTPLVEDEALDVLDYTLGFLRRFESEVRDRFARLG